MRRVRHCRSIEISCSGKVWAWLRSSQGPVICWSSVQDVDTGEVLMQAYADASGIKETVETRQDLTVLATRLLQRHLHWLRQAWLTDVGTFDLTAGVVESAQNYSLESRCPWCSLATFYSRSRGERWCKGETSGNYIHVKGIYFDCDRDSVIYLGDPSGPSCHTVRPTNHCLLFQPPTIQIVPILRKRVTCFGVLESSQILKQHCASRISLAWSEARRPLYQQSRAWCNSLQIEVLPPGFWQVAMALVELLSKLP